MLQPEVGGVDPQLLRDLIEVDLQREPRLWRAVAPLRAAGWLVRERPRALELVAGHVMGDGLQSARVVGARDAVGAVAAAVQQRLEVRSEEHTSELQSLA